MGRRAKLNANETAGEIYDIISAATWLLYPTEMRRRCNSGGLPTDPDVDATLRYLEMNIKIPQQRLDRLFQIDGETNFILWYYRQELWHYTSTGSFLAAVGRLSPQMLASQFSRYCALFQTGSAEAGEFSQPQPGQEALTLAASFEESITVLAGFFSQIYEKLKVAYHKYYKRILELRLDIEKSTAQVPEEVYEVFVSTLFKLDQPERFSSCEIAVSFLDPFIIERCNTEDDSICIVLGIDFKTVAHAQIEKNRASRLDFLGVCKALSDTTRLEILEMLRTDGLYTSKIAEQLSMSFPKALYHINILSEANLLLSYSQGKRIYYKINREFCGFLGDYVKRRYGPV